MAHRTIARNAPLYFVYYIPFAGAMQVFLFIFYYFLLFFTIFSKKG